MSLMEARIINCAQAPRKAGQLPPDNLRPQWACLRLRLGTHGITFNIRGFFKSTLGAAAVEFALAAPLLILLAVGGFEMTRYIIIQQKISKTANTMGNLVAQNQTISTSIMSSMWPAVDNLMEPYNSDANQVVIISDVGNNGTNTIVNWQVSGGGTYSGSSKIGTAGHNATLPTGFTLATNEDTIVTEMYYNFTPLVAPNIVAAQVLYKVKYYKPRLGALTVMNP